MKMKLKCPNCCKKLLEYPAEDTHYCPTHYCPYCKSLWIIIWEGFKK